MQSRNKLVHGLAILAFVQFATCQSLQRFGEFGTKQYYYAEQSVKYTWPEANCFCWNNGFTLVSIESTEEYNYLIQKIPLRHTWMWLDGRDTGGLGQFSWATYGTPLKNIAPWNGNTFKKRSCVDFIVGNWGQPTASGTWDDYPCDQKLNVICQAPGKYPNQKCTGMGDYKP